MHTKLVIFIAASLLLVQAVYSLSGHNISAQTVKCKFYNNRTAALCTLTHPGTVSNWDCDKGKDGKWTCVQSATRYTSDVPPALSDAVSAAAAKGAQDTAKGLLNDNATLQGNNNENNTSNDNVKSPKAPKVPDDSGLN